MALYQSPPGSGSNNGGLPVSYDPGWQNFTNLTPAQILAFQSFAKDLTRYAATRRWLAEISGVTVAGVPLTTFDRDQSKISQLKQAFDAGVVTSPVHFFDAAGNVHAVDATAANALYAGVVSFVENTYTVAADLVTQINANPATITTRKQIDAAYAAIAPNSASATSPSPT